MLRSLSTLTVLTGSLALALASHAQVQFKNVPPAETVKPGQIELIPRNLLFGNPDKAAARISPDGSSIAYLAPVDGVLNIWVGPRDDLSRAKPITSDKKRGIRQYSWAYTGQHIIYLQDSGGDENWRVFSVDVQTGDEKDLTPFKGVAARIINVSEKIPDEILVGLNDRNPVYHDLYRINVRTGERKLVLRNEVMEKGPDGKEASSGYARFVVDDDYKVRFAIKANTDGGVTVYKAPDDAKGEFTVYDSISHEDTDTTDFVDFDKTGKVVYMLDARGRDKAAAFELNIETKEKKLIFGSDQADASGLVINPKTKKVEAIRVNYERDIMAITPESGFNIELYAILSQGGPGDMNITSRSQDDRYWTVTILPDNAVPKTVLVDRIDPSSPQRRPKVTTLFVSKQELVGKPLVKMFPREIKTRDGLEMVSYLSLPWSAAPDDAGKPTHPSPMVLLVHGGPWARDSWGFNPPVQWLANRGYAVLQVNYRGSTGFGKTLLNAGNLEWAGKMHDDLVDAVKWAVEEKIADPSRIAIMGGSYGGYATLVGLTFTPDLFACGVDIVGPSNLNTLLHSIPPYWAPEIELMTKRVGDYRTPEGQKFLDSRSPLNFVDRITKPLLIGQGANDPRVKKAEADQIVNAMNEKHIPVTYVLFPDEGHGFVRPPNRIGFNAVAEAFLAKHLGGRAEPIGDAFKGSTIQVPSGADGVPGLSEALEAMGAGKQSDHSQKQ
ncbi:MAG TPA: S9 family peptidase [Phycisphaerales bacterium]|nr:S9 family peptidase [Phycisphaerales bacterium]